MHYILVLNVKNQTVKQTRQKHLNYYTLENELAPISSWAAAVENQEVKHILFIHAAVCWKFPHLRLFSELRKQTPMRQNGSICVSLFPPTKPAQKETLHTEAAHNCTNICWPVYIFFV